MSGCDKNCNGGSPPPKCCTPPPECPEKFVPTCNVPPTLTFTCPESSCQPPPKPECPPPKPECPCPPPKDECPKPKPPSGGCCK